jgi:pimeloyl-ACP methyl ester carboxylesterase
MPETDVTTRPSPILQPAAETQAAPETEAFILAAADESIRPFEFRASDEDLADLNRRIAATRWPDRETVDDDTQGVQLATMQKLAAYWATQYDWRKCEARLNALPNFMTEIDGVDIHFVHVRSRHEDALPLIVTHGWPGSIVEQLKIVGPLTDPTAYGETAADAFHLVIPSIPGFGSSGKPTMTGWGPERVAHAWGELMTRLGYRRYVAQGGDWGSIITELMARDRAPGLIGIHINLAGAVPEEVNAAAAAGAPAPEGLSEDETKAFERLAWFYKFDLAYAQQMGTRPQTLYGIADSPIGLAAWFLDHDIRSYRMIVRAFDGQPEGLSRDDVLDNITLAWLTNSGVSGARIYWENKFAFVTPRGVTLPVAVSEFPDELYLFPRSWAERAYPKLIHYNKPPKGGHFAAFEQPEYLVDEVRTAFRSLR